MNPVSVEQLRVLIEFLETHPELVLGRFNRTTEGRSLTKRLWEECACLVNAACITSHARTADGWRSYFSEFKSKLLKKIKKHKAQINATGGGSYQSLALTPLQEKIYNILGRDVGEPLEGVRHNPIQVVEENIVNQQNFEPHDDLGVTQGNEVISWDIVPEASNFQNFSLAETAPSDVPALVMPGPRRRNRRRPRNQSPPQPTTSREETNLEKAQKMFLEREEMSASALNRHADSINRLAAAIEKVASVLEAAPPKKKFRRIIIDSDSD